MRHTCGPLTTPCWRRLLLPSFFVPVPGTAAEGEEGDEAGGAAGGIVTGSLGQPGLGRNKTCPTAAAGRGGRGRGRSTSSAGTSCDPTTTCPDHRSRVARVLCRLCASHVPCQTGLWQQQQQPEARERETRLGEGRVGTRHSVSRVSQQHRQND